MHCVLGAGSRNMVTLSHLVAVTNVLVYQQPYVMPGSRIIEATWSLDNKSCASLAAYCEM